MVREILMRASCFHMFMNQNRNFVLKSLEFLRKIHRFKLFR